MCRHLALHQTKRCVVLSADLHVVQVPAAATLEALLAGQAFLQRVLRQTFTA